MATKNASKVPAADTKEEKIRLRLPHGLHAQITELAERSEYHGNTSEVIRDVIRKFIDQQEDVIGSRAHFQRTLRERIDALEHSLTVQKQRTR